MKWLWTTHNQTLRVKAIIGDKHNTIDNKHKMVKINIKTNKE